MGSTFSTIWCRRLYPPGLRMVVATVMGQIPAANSLSQLKYSAPPAKEMRIFPLNWREMRWHISMVRGNRLRPDIYISLLGSSPRRGVHREGVGQLQAKLQAVAVGQGLQALEHGNGVGPLQILVEVVLIEDDVVIAHGVQDAAGRSGSPGWWGCT